MGAVDGKSRRPWKKGLRHFLRHLEDWNSIRSEWSDVSDAYCQDRPGGLYTNLEGKIRACPNTRGLHARSSVEPATQRSIPQGLIVYETRHAPSS